MSNEENTPNNDTDFLVLVTLVSIILSFIPSGIYYLVKKQELDGAKKDYTLSLLNFEITMFVLITVLGVIFAPLSGLTAFFNLIMLIIGTIKTWKKEQFKYPLALNLVK